MDGAYGEDGEPESDTPEELVARLLDTIEIYGRNLTITEALGALQLATLNLFNSARRSVEEG